MQITKQHASGVRTGAPALTLTPAS